MPLQLAFDGTQTIATVEDAHARLCAALAEARDIEIDLTAVTEADLAFVQLLFAVRNSIEAAQGRVVWRGADCAAIAQVMARGGLRAARLFEPAKGDQQ
jgi:hypothetical protein